MATLREWKYKLPELLESNYRQWFNQARTSLEGKDIDHVLTTNQLLQPFGITQEEVTKNEKQWKKDNANARLLLLNGLGEYDQERKGRMESVSYAKDNIL